MITDSEIKAQGLRILAQHLGDIEAERFVALIQREPFDYTAWRRQLHEEDSSFEEISGRAMALRRQADSGTQQSNCALP